MVAGRKIVVVDLDGTLVRRNTLHQFALYALGHGHALSVGWWLALRRLRLVSHRRMKHAMLRATLRMDTAPLVESLLAQVSPRVMALMDRHPGAEMVLATAAPDVYALPLARRLGVRCVATPWTPRLEQYVECRGTEKLRRVRELGQEIVAVVTDHSDDMPLLALEGVKRYLVCPSASTLEAVAGLEYERVD